MHTRHPSKATGVKVITFELQKQRKHLKRQRTQANPYTVHDTVYLGTQSDSDMLRLEKLVRGIDRH